MLGMDIVKDDSGAHAVFTEQGSSASHTTMDVARLPGCDGQAADAVSGYTQVKLEDAPRLLKIPKSECPDVWTRLPRHNGRNRGQTLKIPWCLLNQNSTVIHLLDCYGKDNSKEKLFRTWLGENSVFGIRVISVSTCG